MVKQFRKRPLVVEAIRWDGSNEDELQAFMGGYLKRVIEDMLFICTLEGIMCAFVGDYIIKGVKGEFYSCKPDIFAETYEDATIDPESLRPQGKWINWGKSGTPTYENYGTCSVCHEDAEIYTEHRNYCPNCGAKMKGADNG